MSPTANSLPSQCPTAARKGRDPSAANWRCGLAILGVFSPPRSLWLRLSSAYRCQPYEIGVGRLFGQSWNGSFKYRRLHTACGRDRTLNGTHRLLIYGLVGDWSRAMHGVEWAQVDDVAREEQIECPIDCNSQLALKARQLHQVDGSP